jgi:hypothetical protein
VIYVDPAIWKARGRTWAHLVSDASYDELHVFAEQLGLPRRAFHNDHYDVPAELRDDALALGAQPIPARDLVRKLQQSGLRHRKRRELTRDV